MMKKIKNLLKHEYFIILVCIALIILGLLMYGEDTAISAENKRPGWQTWYLESEKCEMNTRNFLLYIYGENVKIEKIAHVCKVVSGKWSVYVNRELQRKIETDINNIQIDHIVPWSYLKKHVDRAEHDLVYNIYSNLRPVSAKFNARKSNHICDNKIMCAWQREHCEDIQAILKVQNIPNTIDCSSFQYNGMENN